MAAVLGHQSLEDRWNACKVQEEQKATLIEVSMRKPGVLLLLG